MQFIYYKCTRGVILTHGMAIVIHHGSMFEAVLLQCVLHAAVALFHALGEVILNCGVVLLHGLHPLQLCMEASHVRRAHLGRTQQLRTIQNICDYTQCLAEHCKLAKIKVSGHHTCPAVLYSWLSVACSSVVMNSSWVSLCLVSFRSL